MDVNCGIPSSAVACAINNMVWTGLESSDAYLKVGPKVAAGFLETVDLVTHKGLGQWFESKFLVCVVSGNKLEFLFFALQHWSLCYVRLLVPFICL